jgi:hypothetical protein
MSRKLNHYVTGVGIFLMAVALIPGMVGCNYNPPPSQNLEIRTWYDLDAVRNNLAGKYILMNDLDSTAPGYEELASPTANEGKGWQPIGRGCWVASLFGAKLAGGIFTGSLDGQGYTIRDLYINQEEADQVGLFGIIAGGAVIKNMAFTINPTLTPGEASGEPLGLDEDTVRSLDVAPIGGFGGLVGYNGGTVSNCHATGNIGSTGSDLQMVGLVGDNDGIVSNCSFIGTVSGDGTVGGLVGQNEGTVRDCYFVGNVTGYGDVGGLVGHQSGTVTNSYYNYDEVLVNGEHIITVGALFGEDFDQWLANDKSLDINEKLSQESGYYLINDVGDFKQLLGFGEDNSLKFRLNNDLDLADEPNFYIPYLTGEFDGNGHEISNLRLDFDSVSPLGLFGYLPPGGEVSGLSIDNVNITGPSCVGGLVGSNSGTISECRSAGRVTGNSDVGGLVGHAYYGAVSNSYSASRVAGTGNAGGLVGANWYGTVSKSCYTGTVTGTENTGGVVGLNWKGTVTKSYSTGSVTGASWTGGLVGYNSWGTVSKSYSTGTIVGGIITGRWGTGGVAGGNTGTVTNCYSTGNVSCDELVGGLVGFNAGEGSVSNSYSTGNVTGTSRVGGLVGENSGTVTNSFWDTQISGQAASQDGTGTGKTTAQMKSITTFSGAGWNIRAVANAGERDSFYIWNIVNGATYPFPSWQTV